MRFKMEGQTTVLCSIFVIQFKCQFLHTALYTFRLVCSDLFPYFTNSQPWRHKFFDTQLWGKGPKVRGSLFGRTRSNTSYLGSACLSIKSNNSYTHLLSVDSKRQFHARNIVALRSRHAARLQLRALRRRSTIFFGIDHYAAPSVPVFHYRFPPPSKKKIFAGRRNFPGTRKCLPGDFLHENSPPGKCII